VALSGGASAATSSATVAKTLATAKAPAAQLQRTRAFNFSGTQITRYQQTVAGVPVINGEVAVIDGPSTAPALVSDSTVASLGSAAAKATAAAAPKISAARAIAIARSATGASGERARPSAALAIDPEHGGALVRRVVLASVRPLKDFEVIVDAASGRVLAKRNLLKDASAQAKLFTPNPIATNNGYGGIGTQPSADHHDHDTSKLTGERVAVSLPRIKSGQHCLIGKYVNARLGRHGDKVCKSSLNWSNVKRHSNQFEALMGYYHIDNISDVFHSLGFNGNSDVHPQQQTLLADAIPDDNSFYSPATRKLTFGTGGVDDGEDGDVVTHEFGHSIQDAQDRGFGSTDLAGGLGEGFGDFMSAVNTAYTPGLPNYNASEYCIFDWDGVGGYGGPGVAPCGRVADGSDGIDTYPHALNICKIPGSGGQHEVHCMGEIWAHGTIDLFNGIPLEAGVPPILIDVLVSQFGYSDNESFTKAVNALVATDTGVYGGSHVAAICFEMKTTLGIPASSCP
jgi:hypothetical protein